MKNAKILAGLIIILGVLFFVIDRVGTNQSAEPKLATFDTKRSNSSGLHLDGLPVQNTAVLKQNPPAISFGQLVSDYSKEKNLRKFALEASQHPTAGGYFFALQALSVCGPDQAYIKSLFEKGNQEEIRHSSSIQQRKIQVQQMVLTKCEDFLPGEANRLYSEISSKAKDGTDPFVNAQRELRRSYYASDHQSFEKALSFLIKQNAWLALTDSTSSNASTVGSGDVQLKHQKWLNGEDLAIGQDSDFPAFYTLALQVATCDPEVACSLDTGMIQGCIFSGRCYDSRRAYVEAQFLETAVKPQLLAKFNVLVGNMRDALDTGNVRAFLPANY